MKQLVLALLFINIVYYFWGAATTNSVPNKNQRTQLSKEKVEMLTQLSTKSIGGETESKSILTKRLPQKEVGACILITGFTRELEAQELGEALKIEMVLDTVITSVSNNEYWVTYPAGDTWEHSLQNVALLKKKGVVDLWLVTSGENKGVVSLGLFQREERAEKRLKELLLKEIEATRIIRKKVSYGVKVMKGKELRELKAFLQQKKRALTASISKISC